MRDPKERLQDILDAIAAIERYRDRGKTAFEQDELLQTYFVHYLQIIGEAASSVPDETRKLAPGIPWSKIVGMRNVLVHGYFDIDTEIVWAVVERELPVLKPAVELLLQKLQRVASRTPKRNDAQQPNRCGGPTKRRKPGRKKKDDER
jgi:uncharacterized protein with HEPN domain